MFEKYFNKYRSYFYYMFIFIFLLILTSFFPLSGNDYYLFEENIIARIGMFQFGYIGDYLAIIMINNRFIKAFIVSLVIFITSLMVGKTIDKNDDKIPIFFMILLFCINSNLLLKTVVSVSGFTTYFFPLMLLSIYIYLIKKIIILKKYTNYEFIFICFLSFLIGLFNDFISIFIVFSNIYLLLYMIFKSKKFDSKIFLIFIISILSLILMFNSVDMLFNSNHIFDYKSVKVGFIVNAVRNYFNILQSNLLTNNFVINLFVSVVLLLLMNRSKINKWFVKLSSLIIIFFNSFVVFINLFDINVMHGVIHYFVSILSFVYLLALFVLIIYLIKRKEADIFIYLFLLLVVNIGIYSLSSNLNNSAIIYLYYLYILVGLEIVMYLKKYYIKTVYFKLNHLCIVVLVFIGGLIYIYHDIYIYNLNRDNVIYEHFKNGREVLYIPTDNYSSYVYKNYPIGKKMTDAYFKYLNIDFKNIKSEYIDVSSAKYKMEFTTDFKHKNLMIVAHADDELIWGGKELMDEDYVVVCVTCGYNVAPERVPEFSNVMKALNDEYIMLGYRDLENGVKSNWDKDYGFILKDVEDIVNFKNWDKIVVHSPFGESGHIHHKMLNRITTSVVKDKDKLYYFGKYYYNLSEFPEDTVKIDDSYVKKKDELFKKYYKSQAHVKFQMFYPYEKLYSYKDWHSKYDPKYEYN